MRKQIVMGLMSGLLFLPSFNAFGDENLVVISGGLSVPDTVAKLETIIRASPANLMAKIDHGANARDAGLELGQSVLLVFGSPEVGTPIMQENRSAGLDLPAKILVYEQGGQTKIAYTDPQAIREQHAIEGAGQQFDQMSAVLARFVEEAAR